MDGGIICILILHSLLKYLAIEKSKANLIVFTVASLSFSLSCRIHWQKKSYSRNLTLMQSTPYRLWYRYKVRSTCLWLFWPLLNPASILIGSLSVWCLCNSNNSNLYICGCCRSVLAECESLQWICGSVLPGCSEKRLWGNRCCQCFGLAVCGSPFQQEVQLTRSRTHLHDHAVKQRQKCTLSRFM